MRNPLFPLANMHSWDCDTIVDQHVKSIPNLLPIPMTDIRRLTGMDGTLILVRVLGQAAFVGLT